MQQQFNEEMTVHADEMTKWVKKISVLLRQFVNYLDRVECGAMFDDYGGMVE
jgi:hypothetical protein